MKAAKKENNWVLTRTYSAGVHFGILKSRKGKEVELTKARRIWSWCGAKTLNEIAMNGVASGSKISQPVDKIILTESIEIISMSSEAVKILGALSWS